MGQTSQVGNRSVVEYLVVADRDSTDAVDLYPTEGASAGQSSVSLPLGFNPDDRGGVRILDNIRLPDFRTVLWSGRLDLASGEVLISDWSMRPVHRVNVVPGIHTVTIGVFEHPDEPQAIGVRFERD